MNLLNIGPWELAVIIIIGILLVGPKRVVEITRAVGRIVRQIRSISGEFMGAIQSELQETERETRQALEGAGGKKQVFNLQDQLRALESETRQAMNEIARGVRDLVEDEEDEEELRHIQDRLETLESETAQTVDGISRDIEEIVEDEQDPEGE